MNTLKGFFLFILILQYPPTWANIIKLTGEDGHGVITTYKRLLVNMKYKVIHSE